MRPFRIFQWPLSPWGTVQPAKSFPLNKAAKPGGGSLSAAWAAPRANRHSNIAMARVRDLKTCDDHVFMPALSGQHYGWSSRKRRIGVAPVSIFAAFSVAEAGSRIHD